MFGMRYIYTNTKLYMTNMKRLIALLAVAALVLAGCTSKKAEGDDTTAAADSTQEVTTQEETTPKVDPEEAKALITKLYTELYPSDNDIKTFDDVSDLLGDKLNAKLNEMDGEMPVFDYDPFIQAQDLDSKSVMSSLNITELSEDLYQVKVEPLKGNKVTVQLTVGYDDKGELKILDIPSDPNVSVLK